MTQQSCSSISTQEKLKMVEKKPYTSVYNSFSPNHQKLEIIFLQEVDKHWNPTWQEKKKMNELLIQAKIQMRCKRKWTRKAPWHTVRFHFQDLLEKKNQMDREKPN